jgi:UDP-glucose 4-epimerase
VKKIAVIGGAGFVGTNLIKQLSKMGQDVLVVDDLSTGLRSNLQGVKCEFHQVSITDESAIRRALHSCDYIFHLAARGSVPRSIKNPDATFDVNVKGTLNILNYAREHQVPILFSSSSSVYGKNLAIPKNEFMWTSPMTPYAASKLSGEALIHSYGLSFNFPVFSFRFFNIFGPWQRPDHAYAAVIPKWIWQAMNKKVIKVDGDGQQSRDFTYVDNVVSALVEVQDRRLVSDFPINLAFGNRISLNTVLSRLSKYFSDLRVEYGPVRNGDVRDSQNDPTELKRLLPELIPTDFEFGLEKTIAWLYENGSKVAGNPVAEH